MTVVVGGLGRNLNLQINNKELIWKSEGSIYRCIGSNFVFIFLPIPAMTLNSLNANAATSGVNDNKRVTVLGSMLFLRCVSGSRVVSTIEQKELSGYKFEGNNTVLITRTNTEQRSVNVYEYQCTDNRPFAIRTPSGNSRRFRWHFC